MSTQASLGAGLLRARDAQQLVERHGLSTHDVHEAMQLMGRGFPLPRLEQLLSAERIRVGGQPAVEQMGPDRARACVRDLHRALRHVL